LQLSEFKFKNLTSNKLFKAQSEHIFRHASLSGLPSMNGGYIF